MDKVTDGVYFSFLQCALNVIIGIGRRRKVTQSLKSKKSSTYSKTKVASLNNI